MPPLSLGCKSRMKPSDTPHPLLIVNFERVNNLSYWFWWCIHPHTPPHTLTHPYTHSHAVVVCTDSQHVRVCCVCVRVCVVCVVCVCCVCVRVCCVCCVRVCVVCVLCVLCVCVCCVCVRVLCVLCACVCCVCCVCVHVCCVCVVCVCCVCVCVCVCVRVCVCKSNLVPPLSLGYKSRMNPSNALHPFSSLPSLLLCVHAQYRRHPPHMAYCTASSTWTTS